MQVFPALSEGKLSRFKKWRNFGSAVVMLNWKQSVQLVDLAMIVGSVLLGSKTAVGLEGHSESETYGSMHETIGQQQHQGRVKLADLMRKSRFYAARAQEELLSNVVFRGS
jgi:hypothetical protein